MLTINDTLNLNCYRCFLFAPLRASIHDMFFVGGANVFSFPSLKGGTGGLSVWVRINPPPVPPRRGAFGGPVNTYL